MSFDPQFVGFYPQFVGFFRPRLAWLIQALMIVRLFQWFEKRRRLNNVLVN